MKETLSQKPVKRCLTVVGALIKDGKILMTHHRKLDLWLAPGGHINKDETPDQAVVREFKEETGLNVRPVNYCPLGPSPDNEILALPFHVDLHEINQGDCEQHIAFCYYVELIDNNLEIKIQEKEVIEARWISPNEIDNLKTRENIKKLYKLALKNYPKIA